MGDTVKKSGNAEHRSAPDTAIAGQKLKDQQLIAACKAGDKGAMHALVKQFENMVYNAAYRILNNRDDAQDVAQSVFLKVFKNLSSFDPKYRLFSWIYRITINEALNSADKRKHHGDLLDEQHASSANLEKTHDNQTLGSQLQSALMLLSNDYRSAIVLKHIAGCSYSEMSEILEIPEKTVRSRLYSARQHLQASLRDISEQYLER